MTLREIPDDEARVREQRHNIASGGPGYMPTQDEIYRMAEALRKARTRTTWAAVGRPREPWTPPMVSAKGIGRGTPNGHQEARE